MLSAFKEIATVLLVTGAVSLVAGYLLQRLLPADFSQRQAVPIAVGIAWLVGCWLIEPQVRQPARHWHWLPWLGAVAAVLAPIGLASGVRLAERWTLNALVALAASWFLVPTWAHLEPPRAVYAAVFAAGVFLLTGLLELLSRRTSAAWITLAMTLAAACGAGFMADSVSLRFAQLGSVAAATLAGAWVIALRNPAPSPVRGLPLGYAVIVGGLMLIGWVENRTAPRISFLLVPLAPLALAFCSVPPLARLRGASAIVARVVAIGVPLAAALVIAAM
jgi:hypothetical protein